MQMYRGISYRVVGQHTLSRSHAHTKLNLTILLLHTFNAELYSGNQIPVSFYVIYQNYKYV